MAANAAAELLKNKQHKEMDYYTGDRTAVYYKADLDRLTLEKIPAGIPTELKHINAA